MQIRHMDHFIFGRAPRPILCGRQVQIGAGQVIPEINFTLPAMEISEATFPEVRAQYTEMITAVLQRAVALQTPQVLVEFETLPEMTLRPRWGLEITRLLADQMDCFHHRHGLRSALRLTPNDIREFDRPPRMRHGRHWEAMQEVFETCGHAGANLLSIESTGGKEVHDEALLNADLEAVVFSLAVLGARDMAFLWGNMVAACRKNGVIPAGDSACGFANTAMVLAERGMIPRVLAAVVRVATVPRTLVAVTAGAIGPSKDCAYEGPYLKALTGIPISMEGRSAACAHLSPIGNISQAVCDCWSNESVQNVQMLSARAPVVSMEQLVYDCRLLNTAAARSAEHALLLRDWLADSDSALDVQAYVLRPDVVLRIAGQISRHPDPYDQTVTAVRAAIHEIRDGQREGRVTIPERERTWLDALEETADALPDQETLIARIAQKIDPGRCLLSEYGITEYSIV